MIQSSGPASLSLEEEVWRDPHARAAMKKLLALPGSDESQLWQQLHGLRTSRLISLHRWRDKSNMDRRQARAFAARLWQDARDLDGFFTDKYLWYLNAQNRKFLWLKPAVRLLRMCSRLILVLHDQTDDRGPDPEEDFARRSLTEYVEQACGSPHDAEIAELIRVGLNRHDLTAEDQRKYRTRRNKTGSN